MKVAVVNFNGGEYTQKIDTRSDTEKYGSGCRILENMIPSIFGGAEKRTGTEFITTKGAFSTMLASILSHENDELCHGNEVLVIDFDNILSQITCHENDILCHENEVLVDEDTIPFVSRILCHENEVLFHENEVLID